MRTVQTAVERAALAIILLAGLPLIVGATPTTHIWGPSTDVQPYKTWHVTVDMYAPAQFDAVGARIPTVTNVGLTVGLLPSKVINAEIGFDHKSGLGMADNYPLYGNFKLGIPENALAKDVPALAIGIFDVGTEKDITDYNMLYAKIAKTVTVSDAVLGRVSAGYFSGNSKLLRDENGQKDNDGLMLAWEKTISEISDKLWLSIEYMGSNSGYGTWNVGGAWKFAGNVGVLIGYDAFNNDQLANAVTVQVDIDF